MRLSTKRDGRARAQGDAGAALVEFAFVMVLLFTLIFGIISFGLILSFKQDMTRAAAEGARAGAVAFPSSTAQAKAQAATEEAVKAFGGRFSPNGCAYLNTIVQGKAVGECSAVVAPCSAVVGAPLCVTVRLEFNYDDFPLYGAIPLISGFFPDKVVAVSVARINT